MELAPQQIAEATKSLKKVGIDLRCLPADGTPGAGVAHAARELVRALLDLSAPSIEWKLFLPNGASWDLEDARCIRLSSTNGRALRSALKANPIDLLFVPSGAVAPGLSVPVIPWVHDITIYAHPEWFSQSAFRRAVTTRLFLRGLRRAAHICSVSKATADKLVDFFQIEADRLTVTSEGGDSVLAGMTAETLVNAKQRATLRVAERGVTHPFVLLLGTLEPRKNIPLLIEAWLRATDRFSRPVDLVVVGKDGWKLRPIHHAIRLGQQLAKDNHSHLHRISATSDDDRRDLLLAADLVVVPSLDEGFGLVALEAMQASTAVVASDVGGLPEVVGSSGAVLPARASLQWTEAMLHLMQDDESRQHLAEQGKARSQGMTWERSAQIVLNVLTDRG